VTVYYINFLFSCNLYLDLQRDSFRLQDNISCTFFDFTFQPSWYRFPDIIMCNRKWYSDCLQAGKSGDRIPVEARFSAPVQTGPEAHPASCTMGTGSFPGVSCGRGVTLTPHPFLVPRSRTE